MCTVSYIPKKQGFILTSSRDENPSRGVALLPQRYELLDTSIFCPKDPASGGTWLLTSEDNYTLCLLNGAFVAHAKQANYRHSRGQVPLDFFKYDNEVEFIHKYDFLGLEPFTLLILHYALTTTFTVLRWDGMHKHVEVLDSRKSHVFSSATLYTSDVQELRGQWLSEYLLDKKNISITQMAYFHTHTHMEDSYNGLRINRGETLKTVSVCSIDYNPIRTKILYYDLIKNKQFSYRILHLKLGNIVS